MENAPYYFRWNASVAKLVVIVGYPESAAGYEVVRGSIMPGTLLLEEKPLISLYADPSAEEIRQALDQANITNDPDGLHSEARSLFNRLPVPQCLQSLRSEVARFRATALRQGTRADGSRDVELYGIFPQASRFVPHCCPNVHMHWNAAKNVMQFRSLTTILPGTPLQTRWGRSCSCVSHQASDSRRHNIMVAVRDVSPPNQILQALANLNAEGLYLFKDTLLYDLYRHHERQSSNDAMLYLKEAYKAALITVGYEDNRVVHMRQVLQQAGQLEA